jgi:hypothetical protein
MYINDLVFNNLVSKGSNLQKVTQIIIFYKESILRELIGAKWCTNW